ncbi:MAG TPA: biopolymer transporter ExbD [Gemmatimonadales bacterium]|nr:biopolymer transporter ExbD [Gemmatimonadales bacterium]
MPALGLRAHQLQDTPNVTPFIDILLVLLVIFMVSVRFRMAVDAQIPPPNPVAPTQPQLLQLVLELPDAGGFRLNGQPIPDNQLDTHLAQVVATRQTKLLFIKAGADRTYQDVVAAMGRARGAGVQVVGLVPYADR